MVWTLKPLKYYEVVEVDNKNVDGMYLKNSHKSFSNLTGRIFRPSNFGIYFSGSKYPDYELRGHESG